MAAQEAIDEFSSVKGGAEARAKVSEFLSEHYRSEDVEKDFWVELSQVTKYDARVPIDRFLYELGTGQDVNALADGIVSAAEQDAASMRGPVRYVVSVKDTLKRHVFKLTAESEGRAEEDCELTDRSLVKLEVSIRPFRLTLVVG
jgi:hypothetical protein